MDIIRSHYSAYHTKIMQKRPGSPVSKGGIKDDVVKGLINKVVKGEGGISRQ